MPEGLEQVVAFTFHDVADKPQPALHVKHKSAMQHRLRQPSVPVVAAYKKIESLAIQPSLGFYVGNRKPCEWPVGNCLIKAVNSQSVVSRSAAELVTFVSVGDVTVSPRIEEKAL